MTTKVLLTHHHRDAMENAADRGFWMPLPLPVAETSLDELMYLTAVSYGSGQIRELLQIESFEPWREPAGLLQHSCLKRLTPAANAGPLVVFQYWPAVMFWCP